MAKLELVDVKKAFGSVQVIKGVDLEIQSGEFCVFVGPSGCGKSTLLRMISGLTDVSSGEISIDGQVVNDVMAADRELAMVFQSYALYPHMNVRQNLSFGLDNMGVPKEQIKEQVAAVSSMLQIDALLDRKPKDLSGGQRQRVAIGRAVVRHPKIFLFDEPLSNLDAELRVDMRAELSALHGELKNTMVYVTHDQVEAMTLADKIAVLRDGLLEQFGEPLELYNKPCNRFVAGFIGSPSMNFFNGNVSANNPNVIETDFGGTIALKAGQFTVEPGQKVAVGIRPNSLKVSSSGSEMLVKSVEQHGGDSYIAGELGDGSKLNLHQQGQTGTKAGDKVKVEFPAESLYLFDSASEVSLDPIYAGPVRGAA